MILWTQKAANEKIEGLNRELQTASADLVAANDARTTAESRVGELEREASEHAVQIQERDEKITKLTSDLAAANGNQITEAAIQEKALALLNSPTPPAAVQKVIAARVTEALAQAGHPGPVDNVEAEVGGVKTITRAEFQKLPPHEQGAHFRKGGKITD